MCQCSVTRYTQHDERHTQLRQSPECEYADDRRGTALNISIQRNGRDALRAAIGCKNMVLATPKRERHQSIESPERNFLPGKGVVAVSMGGCNTSTKPLGWCFIADGLSGPLVQLSGYNIIFRLNQCVMTLGAGNSHSINSNRRRVHWMHKFQIVGRCEISEHIPEVSGNCHAFNRLG